MTSIEMTAADIIEEHRRYDAVAAETAARLKAKAALLDDELDLYVTPGRERPIAQAKRQAFDDTVERGALIGICGCALIGSVGMMFGLKPLGAILPLPDIFISLLAATIFLVAFVVGGKATIAFVKSIRSPQKADEARLRLSIARSALGIGRANVYWTVGQTIRHRPWKEVDGAAIHFAPGATEPRLTLAISFIRSESGRYGLRFQELPPAVENELRQLVAERLRRPRTAG